MPPSDTLSKIEADRLIAVIRATGEEEAVRVVGALIEGGVTVVELTFTTPGVAGALRKTREFYGNAATIGAGSIRDVLQVIQARDSGAEFLVTPSLRDDVLQAMLETGLPAVPGVFTPSEVAAALDQGAAMVKLFPASTGGVGHMKALFGPFPGLRVVPTGGVDLTNIQAWLAAGAVAVGVGGDLCPRGLMKDGHWSEIAERAQRFADVVSESPRPPSR
jgi:2-dehydro-3-deoxyphosphogluconate aldolase/(4S)-4-hydroxy-2-oxoglutarate aldolase